MTAAGVAGAGFLALLTRLLGLGSSHAQSPAAYAHAQPATQPSGTDSLPSVSAPGSCPTTSELSPGPSTAPSSLPPRPPSSHVHHRRGTSASDERPSLPLPNCRQALPLPVRRTSAPEGNAAAATPHATTPRPPGAPDLRRLSMSSELFARNSAAARVAAASSSARCSYVAEAADATVPTAAVAMHSRRSCPGAEAATRAASQPHGAAPTLSRPSMCLRVFGQNEALVSKHSLFRNSSCGPCGGADDGASAATAPPSARGSCCEACAGGAASQHAPNLSRPSMSLATCGRNEELARLAVMARSSDSRCPRCGAGAGAAAAQDSAPPQFQRRSASLQVRETGLALTDAVDAAAAAMRDALFCQSALDCGGPAHE